MMVAAMMIVFYVGRLVGFYIDAGWSAAPVWLPVPLAPFVEWSVAWWKVQVSQRWLTDAFSSFTGVDVMGARVVGMATTAILSSITILLVGSRKTGEKSTQ